jgi:hypothetical protein
MSWPASPDWLLELQQRFGTLLHTPLDRSTGELRATTQDYDPELTGAVLPTDTLTAAERLAVYHRQYWFRLFTVLQRLYPLTARVVGYWQFNGFAARHLAQQPPTGFDIDSIGCGFDDGLAAYLTGDASVVSGRHGTIAAAAVLEAARIDAAFHRVTRAPLQQPFVPSAADAARLGTCTLQLLPSVALISERWPLAERRLALLERPSDDVVRLDAPLPQTRHWLLSRQHSKVRLLPLEAQEQELLKLVQARPLPQALGELEAAQPEGERATLPERAQTWLARSVKLGIWAGLSE